MSVQIITNNQPRDLFPVADLPPEEVQSHGLDYIDGEDAHSPRLFRYRGNVYDTGEFTRAPASLAKDWDGAHGESYFSGVLVRFVDNYERVVVGSWFS